MPVYVFQHNTEPIEGAYCPRGAARDMWNSRDFESIISGPAETGKTYACMQLVDALAWKYAKSQHVIARKFYNHILPGAVRTYLRVINADAQNNSPTGIRCFGGHRPEWFDYPNGSRIWVAGLDNAGKALSSERDTIYVNQAEEISEADWGILSTRCTGRGAVMPYTRLTGDCNPDAPSHWIKNRRSLKLFESRHVDNPTLYDESGNLTPQGVKTMGILDNLPGILKLRLRDGRWVQAEGVVYEDWDPAIHVIPHMPLGWRHWRKIRSIDFGLNNPFVCQWWAVDGDGRMYLYREIYMSHRLVQEHAAGVRDERGNVVVPGIVQLSGDEKYEITVADHDKEGRATLARYGVPTAPAWKDTETGIQAVAARLKKQADGLPRLFVLGGCTVEYDERLIAAKLPTSTEREPDMYLWEKRGKNATGASGKPKKEEPVKENDHGMDAMRYAVSYVDLRGRSKYVVMDDVKVAM